MVAEIGKKKKYLEGTDGWYFLDNDSNQVLKEIQGLSPQSQLAAEKWVALNKVRQSIAIAKGVKLLTYVVPNKHSVFSKYLPKSIKISDSRLISKVMGYKPDNFIYEHEIFCDDDDTFHKTDTHWTDYGAYLAYRTIAEELNFEGYVDLPKSSFLLKEFVGDLRPGNVLENSLFNTKLPSSDLIYDNGIQHVGRIRSWVNESSGTDRVLLIFGGSSTNQIIQFFTETIKTVVHIWTQSIDWSLVSDFHADYVINLPRERFMTSVPKDDMRFDYRQTASLKYLEGGKYFDATEAANNNKYFSGLSVQSSLECLSHSIADMTYQEYLDSFGSNKMFRNLPKLYLFELITYLDSIGSKDDVISDVEFHSFLKGLEVLPISKTANYSARLGGALIGKLDIDLLRDSAIALESISIEKAYQLMSIAHRLRPKGPLIKQKLDSYEKKINLTLEVKK